MTTPYRKDREYISDSELLLAEWNWEKNSISPYETSIGSAKRCFWICSVCGCTWSTPAYSRGSNGCGCPECAKKRRGLSRRRSCAAKNSLIAAFPRIAQEWHPTKNGDLDLNTLAAFSNVKVWWLCSVCGNEWQTSVNHRTTEKNGCPVCSKRLSAMHKMKTHTERNNLAFNYPFVAKEWHPTKNGDRQPEDYSVSSNQTVWWLCSFCGNEWKSSINHRTSGRGCPACSKAQTSIPEQTVHYYVLKVFRDAVNRYNDGFELDIFIPSIRTAIEYDGFVYHNSSKALSKDNAKDKFCMENGIRLIRFRSPRLEDTENAIRITCEDYQIKEGIQNLFAILGTDCPDIDIDRDRIRIIENFRQVQTERSIESRFPKVAEEWHPTKNGMIRPGSTPAMSNVKFWWKCGFCGYEWQDTPNHRCGRGSGCPVCAGKVVITGKNDLASICPSVAAEWDYKRNEPLLPTQVASKSNKKVWWRCVAYGHIWRATISERTREGHSTGCPYCGNKKVLKGFNDLASTNPHLAKEWSEKNGLNPTEITAGSHKKAWWRCRHCGHEWKAAIYSRKICGCPVCNR